MLLSRLQANTNDFMQKKKKVFHDLFVAVLPVVVFRCIKLNSEHATGDMKMTCKRFCCLSIETSVLEFCVKIENVLSWLREQ